MRILLAKPLSGLLTTSLTFIPFYSFASRPPSPPSPLTYNINLEQNSSYLKKLERSETLLKQNQKVSLIPRRKKRIYDRQRIDRNIEGYGAFRIFQDEDKIYKINQNCMTVERKIMIQPKWLIHGFGIGALPINNPRSSHREFHFMDNHLNRYLLYEYRNTTDFKQNIQDYNYEDQSDIHPRRRIKKRLSPEQFWKSQQKYQFRLNATLYALEFKFQEWILKEIQKRKSMKSYDQYIDQKFGKVYTFNRKEQAKMFQVLMPMVTQLTPQDFQPKKGEKKIQKVQKVEKKQKNDKKKDKKSEKAAEKQQKQQQKAQQKQSPIQQTDKKQVPQAPTATKLDQKYRIKPKMTIPESQRTKSNQKAESKKSN